MMNSRKITAIMLAALMAISLFTGCQKKKTGATLELPLENFYRSQEITHAGGWSMLDAIGDCIYFSKYTLQQKSIVLLEYNTTTGASREITPACEKEREAANTLGASIVMELEDGKRGLLCEEYKAKAFQDPEIIRRCIEVYDADWNLLETKELPEDFCEDVNLTHYSTAWDAQGNLYVYTTDEQTGEKRIDTYNSEFEQYGSISFSPESFSSTPFVRDAEGNMYSYHMQYNEVGHADHRFYRLSAADRTMEDVDVSINFDDMRFIINGTGDYEFYYVAEADLYGVNADGRTKIIDFVNSDFRKNSIADCVALANGKFVIEYWVQNKPTFWLAEKRSQEEIENTKFITLAAVGTYDKLVDAVMEFNRENEGWRIMIVDYAEGEDPEQIKEGLARMQEEMRSGFVADLVCTDGLNFESFASKGLFDDWYDVLAQDENFRREDYLENFFCAYEHDGKLQRLGFDFTVYTQLAKTEHVGEKQGYTMAEFLQLTEEIDIRPYQYYWYMYDSQTGVVDKESQKCYYDTPESVGIMQLLNGTPEQREQVTNHELDFREDKALFYPCMIRSPIDYHSIRKANFLDAQLTFTGQPMYILKGNGGQFDTTFTLSVNAQTLQSEGIRNFAMYLLSEKYQKKLNTSMPVRKETLEYSLKLAQRQTMHTTYFNMQEVNVGAATQEEMEELRAYIEGIACACTKDETISNIVLEETEMFTAGDCTAQEAAKKIQSRVEIYINEQS
ncbi:MAG: hypothetical protein IKL00_04830 [Oscillospiraceae bacterium]|nr:hypothetical protein [Oscillospiraceae bacterium]